MASNSYARYSGLGSGGGSGTGTVTSVGLTDSSTTSIFTITGSPITSSGNLVITLKSETANTVFAAPNGSAGQPSFRLLVAADIPTLPYLSTTLGTANGLSVSTNTLSLGTASTSTTGALTSTDWNTFNGKQAALGFTPENSANKGAASGYCPLDSSSKVPIANLPSVVMEYQGAWNPSTNTPTLVDGSGTNGNVYYVSAAQSAAVSGLTDPSMVNFQIGDLVIYTASISKWQLVTPAAGVRSVNGSQGAVTVNAINQLTGDVTAGPASGSASAAATVASVGGSSAANVNTATTLVTGSKTANTVLAAPNGSAGTATFRALVAADLPSIDALLPSETGNSGKFLTTNGSSASWGLPSTLTVQSKTSTYTILATDDIILCDATSGAFTVTMPTASGNSGKLIRLQKTDSTFNAVTISGPGKTLNTQYETRVYVSNGTSWVLVDWDTSTDWQSYTATLTNWGTGPTLIYSSWRRVNDTIELMGFAGAGAAPSGNTGVSLPSGLTVDNGNVKISNVDYSAVGSVGMASQGSTIIPITIGGATQLSFGYQSSGSTALTPQAVVPAGAATSWNAKFPISGWGR